MASTQIGRGSELLPTKVPDQASLGLKRHKHPEVEIEI